MPTETIDSDELAALRQQAASALPWQHEAARLADALSAERPDHPLLRGEPWLAYFKAKSEHTVFEPGMDEEEREVFQQLAKEGLSGEMGTDDR